MLAAESCQFQCAVNGDYYHLMLKLVADSDSSMISEGLGRRGRGWGVGRGEGREMYMEKPTLSKCEHILYGIRFQRYLSPIVHGDFIIFHLNLNRGMLE